MLLQAGFQRRATRWRNQLTSFATVEVAEVAEQLHDPFAVALDCGGSQLQQPVGGLSHGRDHYQRTLSHAPRDDICRALDGLGAPYRGSTEFQDNHGELTD